MDSRRPRLDRRWLGGCLALAAALRLFRLGRQSLWTDEMISINQAIYASGWEFWQRLVRDIHGPFNSAMLHMWYPLAESEAWWRLLYAIPAIACVPLFYRLAADLFDERAGRVACLAAAVSPFHVWYAQEIRSYSWAILWIVATLVVFLRLWDDRGSRSSWVALAALLAVGVLTNYSVLFLVVALSVALLWRRPFSKGLAVRWVLACGFVGLVFLPWFVDWFARMGGERIFVAAEPPLGVPLREASGFSLLGIPYVAWTFAFGYTLGPTLQDLHLDRSITTFLPHVPFLGLGALVVAVGAFRGIVSAARRGRGALLATLFIVPLALAVFLAVREIKTFHPRYLIAMFPVALVVAAAGWSRRGRFTRATAIGALVLAALSLGNHYFRPEYGKEASREAASFIRANEVPGDAIVVIYAFHPFEHYFQDRFHGEAHLLNLHKRFLRTDEQIRAHVADAQRERDRVWLVLSRWWEVAPESDIRRVFEESLAETGRWDFPGVKVTLYEGGAV